MILRCVCNGSYLNTVHSLVEWRNELGGQNMSVFASGRQCRYDPDLVRCANWIADQLAAGKVDYREACRRLIRRTDLIDEEYIRWGTRVQGTDKLVQEFGLRLKIPENDPDSRYVFLELTE